MLLQSSDKSNTVLACTIVATFQITLMEEATVQYSIEQGDILIWLASQVCQPSPNQANFYVDFGGMDQTTSIY
jgi:hypothetical protein